MMDYGIKTVRKAANIAGLFGIRFVLTEEPVVESDHPLDGWTVSEVVQLRFDGTDFVKTTTKFEVRNHSRDANAPRGAFGIVIRFFGLWFWLWLDCTGECSGSCSDSASSNSASVSSGDASSSTIAGPGL